MQIKEILNKPIKLSNKYNLEINEIRKIDINKEHDDIPDAIAYGLSAIIKNSGFRGKKENE